MVTCHPNAFFSAQPIVDVGGFLVVAFAFVISFQPGLLPQSCLHGTEIREELVGLAEMKQIPELQAGGVYDEHQVVHPSVFGFFPWSQGTLRGFQKLLVIDSETFKLLKT